MHIKVRGGQVLSGTITPSGSKNSIVALIPATILFNQPVTLSNVPEITDVAKLIDLLTQLGSHINWDKSQKTLTIDNSELNPDLLSQSNLANIRATSLLWGPLLGRFRKVSFDDLPGGCTLGIRPLDPHFKAFQDLGATIKTATRSAIEMEASQARPNTIWLTEMSPTATENAIMFAVTIPGTTIISGAASEPQVQDVCNFLIAAGASISGVGSNVLVINGGKPLHPLTYSILPDHYEIATFLALGAATGGEIHIANAIPNHFPAINHEFSKLGITINYQADTAIVKPDQFSRSAVEHKNLPTIIRAQPWPALPVDLLPMFIALSLATPHGHQFIFHNWMYEAGLFWTSELQKFGANVVMMDPHRVLVTPGNQLVGATVDAPYIIRAAVALVMTAMLAKGESIIKNADAVYRGHANFAANLRSLGAQIEEI
jgi:UDP-N-acetylglucosamine 1-carboxyvinyltransferase